MDVYTLARIKSRYPVDDSVYSPRPTAADYLFRVQSRSYSTAWDKEKYVLAAALSQPEMKPQSLADQVFGNQARQQKLQVMHEASLISGRYELHKRHLRDLKHRLSQVQEKISIVRMFEPGLPSRQQLDLEKLLFNLEGQERDEENAFWSDTLKIKQGLFSAIGEYQSAQHRANVFRDLEAEHAG